MRDLKYRADVDGLRAIAILFVLIYHGGLSLFPSGFIGVDIFFVISGFLITRILNDSLNNNRFSFIDFYNRRLWRLQPVFIGLIFITTLLALFFFLPDDLIQYSRSARKASLFLSNLYFQQTTTGYFSPDSHQLPLLHTWSLAIEWQCYLIFPIIMYLLYRFLRQQHIALAIYCLTLLSFVLSLCLSLKQPVESYYHLLSRLFEFFIGSCVAVSHFTRVALPKQVITTLGIMALFSLFYVAGLNNILLGYPNYYTLVVCIATGLLIQLGQSYPHHPLIQALSIRPLVFVGFLSYSLYLWHWVVFSFLRYQTIEETRLVLSMAYLLTFLLGYMSWRYIEKPSRQFHRIKLMYTVLMLLFLPIVFTHLSSYVIKKNLGLPQRFNSELVTIYQQLDHSTRHQRPMCIGNGKIDNGAQCKIGSLNPNSRTGLMIGDSFSNHYWGFMDELGKAANVAILAQGTSSCLTLPGIYLYDWWNYKDRVYQSCYDQTAHYFQMIKSNHYDYVLMGQIWTNYLGANVINSIGDQRSALLTKERIEAALDEALHLINDTGAIPILIESTASMKTNFHDCFFKHIKLRTKYDPKQCSFHLVTTDDDQWIKNLFGRMKRKYPTLITINPKKVQCPNNECRADINGIPVYRDVGHLTDYASYQLGKLYLEQFKNPMDAKV